MTKQQRSVPTAVYERPIKGRLVVKLDNGESWDATQQDLFQLRLVDRYDAYASFCSFLERVLNPDEQALAFDITDSVLNPIRYAAEISISMPRLLEEDPTYLDEQVEEVREMVKLLIEEKA